MQKVKPKDIRNALIVERATHGRSVAAISEEFDVTRAVVERAIDGSQAQAKMRTCLDDIERRVNDELPELLGLSLTALKNILTTPHAERADKLKAAKIVLDTALTLTKLTTPKFEQKVG
jgi:hypothetical protein